MRRARGPPGQVWEALLQTCLIGLSKCNHGSLYIRGGRYGKNIISQFFYIYHDFTILSRFFVMLVLLFCLSSAAKLISLL